MIIIIIVVKIIIVLVWCKPVSLWPAREEDLSSVECVVDLLVVGAVSGPTVYKRPESDYELAKGMIY